MGMLFPSQAVVYLGARLSAEFAAVAVSPARGLSYWQGSSDDAEEFRAALDGSLQKKSPALGSITLEYFDLLIPDSADGDAPTGSDPSSGKSYKRWIIFWKDLRKKDKANYKKLVNGVLEVLVGSVPAIKSITFSSTEDKSIKVDIKDTGSNRAITLLTPAWHKVKNAKIVKKKANKSTKKTAK